MTKEELRLQEDRDRKANWKRWGPYHSVNALWGTVREDYSPGRQGVGVFPPRSSPPCAYRWSEDGLAGISDRHQCICLALLSGMATTRS